MRGKSFELMKMLVGFFLSGVLGVAVTHYFKGLEHQEADRAQLLQTKMTVANDVEAAIANRYFRALQANAAQSGEMNETQIQSRLRAYDQAVVGALPRPRAFKSLSKSW